AVRASVRGPEDDGSGGDVPLGDIDREVALCAVDDTGRGCEAMPRAAAGDEQPDDGAGEQAGGEMPQGIHGPDIGSSDPNLETERTISRFSGTSPVRPRSRRFAVRWSPPRPERLTPR